MYTMHYDPVKNRIDIKIIKINKDNVDNYIADYTKVLESVKPGFIGLADLSESQLVTPDVAEKLGSLGPVSVDKGMRKWAYYTGSAISKLQMKRMFGELADAFEKREEAEHFLTN
ncbi:hypothetical protein [Paenibacillus popilliae]|uniref:FOG: WD40 repeat n=1 Tax=Paenibacillus popilliae ATCC 14706 TaxID=1212764 RepID=M9LFM0_PAEPP|nr:hypothetical protein [Paenibacillus popilliae]GAC41120.1 FOG: WD40 repeat [Paenibacillus popilliae ATCC 14706]